MSVAENLRELRKKKGMTQQDVADKVGVDRSMIAQFERGSRVPTITLGRDIAVALGVSVDDLLK